MKQNDFRESFFSEFSTADVLNLSEGRKNQLSDKIIIEPLKRE
jgi:hypothetical protein